MVELSVHFTPKLLVMEIGLKRLNKRQSLSYELVVIGLLCQLHSGNNIVVSGLKPISRFDSRFNGVLLSQGRTGLIRVTPEVRLGGL
jgi:hypothetical protein